MQQLGRRLPGDQGVARCFMLASHMQPCCIPSCALSLSQTFTSMLLWRAGRPPKGGVYRPERVAAALGHRAAATPIRSGGSAAAAPAGAARVAPWLEVSQGRPPSVLSFLVPAAMRSKLTSPCCCQL
jgi:hypothetical protein